MIRLSPKEVETLQLSALGLSDTQIARRLVVGITAVHGRASRGQAKLRAASRAHAVGLLIASGVISGPESVEVEVSALAGVRRSLADFAEDYKILRARGLGRPEIAVKLQLKLKTVERYVYRARRAGLLPPHNGRAS